MTTIEKIQAQIDAQRESDRRALIAELRERAGHYVPVWGGRYNYSLYWRDKDARWQWGNNSNVDQCPRSGYFSAPIDGLIEEMGERLNLLRDFP